MAGSDYRCRQQRVARAGNDFARGAKQRAWTREGRKKQKNADVHPQVAAPGLAEREGSVIRAAADVERRPSPKQDR